jgi:hypothetical protein
MFSQLDKALKTKDDLQTMLVILFLVFIVGVKCYMMIAAPQKIASQQKTETHTTANNHSLWSYSQLLKSLILI